MTAPTDTELAVASPAVALGAASRGHDAGEATCAASAGSASSPVRPTMPPSAATPPPLPLLAAEVRLTAAGAAAYPALGLTVGTIGRVRSVLDRLSPPQVGVQFPGTFPLPYTATEVEPVRPMTAVAPTVPPSAPPPTAVLTRAADLYDAGMGWCQGTRRTFDGAAGCALYAVEAAADSLIPQDVPSRWRVVEDAHEDACLRLQDHLQRTTGRGVVAAWNDEPGRTVDDVIAALRAAAQDPAEGSLGEGGPSVAAPT